MKKTKFTFVDAAIILVVIIAAVFAVKILKPAESTDKGEAEFAVLVSSCDSGSGDIVNIGDEVSISFSEISYATITGVEETEHIESKFNENLGKYVSLPVAGKSDLKITARCEADISDTAIKNGKTAIRVGSEMPIRGKGYTFKGYVVEVEER